MKLEFDPEKSARNVRERGLPFDSVEDFDFETALFTIDERQDYGETRMRAFGYLNGRLHALVFKPIPGGLRIISLRRANSREVKRYEQAQKA
jgi:uncharacterized DUF497 family protein